MEDIVDKQVTNNRQRAVDRLKGKYPDKNFDDEEAFYGQINDDYDEYDKQLGGYKEREKSLSDMFNADPRSAAYLTSWRKGGDPAVELVRQFGTEIKDAIDDPERLDAISEANKEYVERVAKEKQLDEEYHKNLEASLLYLDELQQKSGLSDDDVDKTMEFLVSIVKDGIMGRFSPESIDMARKAINHDVDVESASMEGEVRGKNTNVTEKLRKKSAGDGTAQLDGKNGGVKRTIPRSLGALDNYGDNSKNIWERGQEKRTKVNI